MNAIPAPIRIKGESMRPWLNPGDELLFSEENSDQFAVGDIFLTRWDQEWVAHRVIEISGKLFLKGDFSFQCHDFVPAFAHVVGRKRGRKILQWTQKSTFGKKLTAKLSSKLVSASKPQRLVIKSLIYFFASLQRLVFEKNI